MRENEKDPMRNSIEHFDDRLDDVMKAIKDIHSAFPQNPDGTTDFSGHRRYHEELIESAQAQTEFWRELRLDLAKKGTWVVLVAVIGMIAAGVGAKFGLTK